MSIMKDFAGMTGSMRTLCSPAVILREQINPSAGNGFHRSGKSGKERML